MDEEIVRDIVWTPRAARSYNQVIEYLQQEWSDKEVEQFITTTTLFLQKLKRYPEMCRPSGKRKHVRVGILNKHTQLIYHYKPRKHQIEILLFWGARQDPSRLRY
ncbi:MAG: type II toxin-antitoxin system RelE/ParE family toxin [Bacteroidetes bacterium]|nr:type II toxin-antitoxin system RelE/ParE family toxin [Bacteroidota bacterium]